MDHVIKLEDVDYSSAVWRRIETQLADRIEYLHGRLESCDPSELCRYQAEIRVLRGIITQAKEGNREQRS